MQFDSVSDLNSSDIKVFPSGVSLGEHTFKFVDSQSVNLKELVDGTQSALMIYDSVDSDRLLISKWKLTNTGQCDVKWALVEGTTSRQLPESDQVGLDMDVVILNFNKNQPISGKVDTGADLCAIHATDIKQDGNSVTFVFNGTRFTMQIADTVTIARAGDEQQRIVVNFTFIVADKKIPNIKCTLTDRSGLDSPLLIGKNLIIASGITINPSLTETVQSVTINYEDLDRQFNESYT